MYQILHTTVHRHTTIVTNETFVNSREGGGGGACRLSSDTAVNANGDQVSDLVALGHFRHELYFGSKYLWLLI